VTQYLGWRWANWIVLILGGVATALMWIIKETYSPTLLQQKAKKLRKQEGEERYWSRYDQRLGFVELMKVNLSRPLIMAVKEPICIFWNVYIAIIYGTANNSIALTYPTNIFQASFTSASSPTPSSSKEPVTSPSASPA
jgi:ATP/ADP translocase